LITNYEGFTLVQQTNPISYIHPPSRLAWPVKCGRGEWVCILIFASEDSFEEHIESQGTRFMVTKVTDTTYPLWLRFLDSVIIGYTKRDSTNRYLHFSIGSILALSLKGKVRAWDPSRDHSKILSSCGNYDSKHALFPCDGSCIYSKGELGNINASCPFAVAYHQGRCTLGDALCTRHYESFSL